MSNAINTQAPISNVRNGGQRLPVDDKPVAGVQVEDGALTSREYRAAIAIVKAFDARYEDSWGGKREIKGGNDAIDRREFADPLFHQLDTNGDEQLSPNEIVQALRALPPDRREAAIKNALKLVPNVKREPDAALVGIGAAVGALGSISLGLSRFPVVYNFSPEMLVVLLIGAVGLAIGAGLGIWGGAALRDHQAAPDRAARLEVMRALDLS